MTNSNPSKHTFDWGSLHGGIDDVLRATFWLAQFRDQILVGAAVVYVIGYGVWSLHSWNNGLGLLPAADLQYFVAGLLPLVTFMVGYAILRFVMALLVRILRKPRARRALRNTVIGLGICGFILLMIPATSFAGSLIIGAVVIFSTFLGSLLPTLSRGKRDIVSTPKPPQLSAAAVSSVRQFLADQQLQQMHAESKQAIADNKRLGDNLRVLLTNVFKGFRRVGAVGIAGVGFAAVRIWAGLVYLGLSIYLLLLVIYVGIFLIFVAYPALPQELGGIRPQCAQLELAAGEVSTETIEAFAPEVDPGALPEIVRTPNVDVMYSRGDLLLVRPGRGSSGPVYQMSNAVLRTVVGCGRD